MCYDLSYSSVVFIKIYPIEDSYIFYYVALVCEDEIDLVCYS